MGDFLSFVLFIGVWIFLQAYLLPRLGVKT
jgi:hypothetical protein